MEEHTFFLINEMCFFVLQFDWKHNLLTAIKLEKIFCQVYIFGNLIVMTSVPH